MDPNLDHPEDNAGGEIIWLFDPDATPAADTYTPAELFRRLARAAAREGLTDVTVCGTVRGLRRRGRICTFELTDRTDLTAKTAAVVRVVVFPDELRAVDAAAAKSRRGLGDGLAATVSGEVRFDPAFGGVRIVAASVDVHEGNSELAARTAALVEDLDRSGLLTKQASLVVPGRPVRVGLITAPGTAGDVDVSTVLKTSGMDWHVLRQAVPMAGPNAPASVAAAIGRLCGATADVIVIARGGGGRSELDCWDSEVVARAIANATVPVWTAIGHASDATVADRVANRSCPTPSAAAAELVARVRDFERRRHEQDVFTEHRHRVAAERTRVRHARVIAAVAVALLLVIVVLLAMR